MKRPEEIIKAEKEVKNRIMGLAVALVDELDMPVVLLCRDRFGQVFVYENPQSFNNALDFKFED